ncbi:ABC transporter substrate-binding protein [Bacillus sp. EB600]|uniref:ABC transporter substrate-binding protein n=1 Tax=Bacillus sp. EB600 TaxID=2806345 RepID=UPI002109F798|nr:ABC transporter substrate-binding protein [Bacillus sp. EB600]MCQ6279934.1 ABC transporter substrate-binding protein [Bacillus sp. EB600]
MNRKIRFSAISLVIAILLLLSACSSQKTSSSSEKDPIVLGSTMAMTGGTGYLGQGFKKSYDLAIKKINEDGGINGRKVKIIYYDDENKPEKAVQNVQRLIKKDGVHIILGPSTATTSSAVQPIVDREKVIMFSGSSAYTAPANSFGFNTTLKQEAMHQIHHEWFIQKGIKKVGLLATTDSSGDVSVNIVNSKFNHKNGIEYVIERMGLDETDVSPQLTKLKSEGIQALVIIGPGAPPIIAIKNAVQANFNMPILLTHSQVSRQFAESIKGFIPNQLYFAGTAPMAYKEVQADNPLKPLMVKFAEDYKKEYNAEIDHVAAVGYDSVLSVIKGIQMAGSDDPAKIKNVFETKFKNMNFTTSVVNYTTKDHQGTNMDGAVLLRLDKDLSWHIEWEPKFWKK